ncbi:MAG: glycosyltransferase [Planctomycetota bacterium]
MKFRRKTLPAEPIDEATERATAELDETLVPGEEADFEPPPPIGIVAPEWSLQRSARGAALWRHAEAMTVSAGERVEILALDRDADGRRFHRRDQWNVPAPDARFRVRRIAAGHGEAGFDELDRARLEGAVLDWVRERRPRLVHVLDLEAFGPGVLLALDAAQVPTVVTLSRVDELRAGSDPSRSAESVRAALSSVERIVVKSAADASVAEAAGAPRTRIRVMKPGTGGEIAILRAYASLYRMLAPREPAAV